LVVSHDRSLLETLTTRTLRVDRGNVTLWNGAYSEASAGWLAVESAARAQHDRLKSEAKKAERHLVELRQVNEQKRARFKRTNNTASFKDIDSRSAARQSKHREGEKAAGKTLSTAAKASQRAADAVAADGMRRTVGGDVSFAFEPAPKRLVASHVGPLKVGDLTIIEHVEISVERTDRIWVRGPNGVGKTTLLRALISNAGLPTDKVLFLEQEMTPEEVDGVVAQMQALPTDQRGSVLGIVALLGVDPAVLLASKRPSPGEARKLAMALGLGRAAWLLVLDEPTNHLDLPSIERLQTALAGYPGALVVVTHDAEFAKNLNLEPHDLMRDAEWPNGTS
jgi:ATPase subunit of ABC transporter with duplicated ATPase domains